MTGPAIPSPTTFSLTDVEALLAAYAACTITGSTRGSPEIVERLFDLDVPVSLLEAIRRVAGRWTVSDDDRIDVIVSYVAAAVRAPHDQTACDDAGVRAVGLSDFDLIELDLVVAFYQ